MSILRRDTKNKPRWKDLYDREPEVPTISEGHMTMAIPVSLYVDNRKRLITAMRKVVPRSLIILKAAGHEPCIRSEPFIQDPFFFWAFGYGVPGVMGAIDVGNNRSYLIVERLSKDGLHWNGKGFTKRSEFKKKFLVNGVWFLDELKVFLDFMKKHNDCRELLILAGQEKELHKYIVEDEKIENHNLHPVIWDCMVHKTEMEIKILRYTTKVLESAIIYIMKRLRPGMTNNQVEAWFNFFMVYKSGFERLSFNLARGRDPIECLYEKCHWPNVGKVKLLEEGDLCVVDVGAAYYGYYVSLGIVVPVSEKFSISQRVAYDMIMRVRRCICEELMPMAPIKHLHTVAEKCLLEVLIDDLNLLYGTVEGAFKAGVGRLLLHNRIVTSLDENYEHLTHLETGRVYLLQIGCSFAKRFLNLAFQNQYFKPYLRTELRTFENIMVRISDPVLITVHGFEFLTTIPRGSNLVQEFRLKNAVKKRRSIIEAEKYNLTVHPSLFNPRE